MPLPSPSGSFAPSGSVPLGQVAVEPAVAVRSVCPLLLSQGSCWYVLQPEYPGALSAILGNLDRLKPSLIYPSVLILLYKNSPQINRSPLKTLKGSDHLPTNFPPAKRAILVELECKQIWCSPGVWEVKVNRPSDPY